MPPGQPTIVTGVQAHVRLSQQTPVQGEEQLPPQTKVFGAAHSARVVTVQTPVTLLQHLPVQGEGEQVPLQ